MYPYFWKADNGIAKNSPVLNSTGFQIGFMKLLNPSMMIPLDMGVLTSCPLTTKHFLMVMGDENINSLADDSLVKI